MIATQRTVRKRDTLESKTCISGSEMKPNNNSVNKRRPRHHSSFASCKAFFESIDMPNEPYWDGRAKAD